MATLADPGFVVTVPAITLPKVEDSKMKFNDSTRLKLLTQETTGKGEDLARQVFQTWG